MKRIGFILTAFALGVFVYIGCAGETWNERFGTLDVEAVTSSAAELNILDGATATTAQINYLSGVTAGTSAASKAVVLDANSKINALYVTTLSADSYTGAKATQTVYQITAAADTAYSAGSYKVSGDLFYASPIAQKSTLLLQSAVKGAWFDVFVQDADSLRITTASGDTLVTSAGAVYKTTTSVAGTARLVGLDTTHWLMLYTLGTWTSY